MTLLSVADAQARILALAPMLQAETVALGAAAGRWAAADVSALRDQPAADLSAMDGYALRLAELPGPLRLKGESAAGERLPLPVAPGEALRIFTGAPMPAGADTVLMQEEAEVRGGWLRLAGEGPARVGQHVRPRGSDFASGTVLVSAGERITPARIALAALGGHGALAVRRRARIALISTGDELAVPGAPLAAHMLPASNAPMLQALVGDLPVDVTDFGIIPDRLDALTAALREASARADVVVTTGGASVGDHDLVRPALEAAGATLDFWRIAMKPGKPLLAGTLGDAVVLGLPGNPVSAYVTAALFLRPLVAACMGSGDPFPATRRARLGAPLPATGGRAEYLRARLRDGEVVEVASQDSAAVRALAAATLLVVRPAGSPAASAGDMVDTLALFS